MVVPTSCRVYDPVTRSGDIRPEGPEIFERPMNSTDNAEILAAFAVGIMFLIFVFALYG